VENRTEHADESETRIKNTLTRLFDRACILSYGCSAVYALNARKTKIPEALKQLLLGIFECGQFK
jgi:hypothetical protein